MERRTVERETEADRFSSAIQPYIGPMQRFSASLAGSSWDGDDLFQTAMIKAYKAWRQKPLRAMTKAYLFRIIRNAWIDAHRKVAVDETIRDSFEDMADQKATRTDDDEKLAAGMKLLIDRLTPKQRLIFLMIAGLGCRPAEVAERTGESETNVRVVYHRARKKLRLVRERAIPLRAPDELAELYIQAFRSGDPEMLHCLFHWETSALPSAAKPVTSSTLRQESARPARFLRAAKDRVRTGSADFMLAA